MAKFSPVNIEERKKIDIRPGDTVRVSLRVEEKGKVRTQAFEGMVIAKKHGTEPGATFTVRKVASGVGVERVFPLFSQLIEKIEVRKRAKVRRAKLYFVRRKAVKEISKKMKRTKQVTDSLYVESDNKDAGDVEDQNEVMAEEKTEEVVV